MSINFQVEVYPSSVADLDDDTYFDHTMRVTEEVEDLIRRVLGANKISETLVFGEETRCDYYWMRRFIEPHFLRLLVARDVNDAVVGVLGIEELRLSSDEAPEFMRVLGIAHAYHGNWAYVDSAMRGQGIMRELIRTFEKEVYQARPLPILLNVLKGDGVAKVWERFGFQRIETTSTSSTAIHEIPGMEEFQGKLDLMLRA